MQALPAGQAYHIHRGTTAGMVACAPALLTDPGHEHTDQNQHQGFELRQMPKNSFISIEIALP